jgi:hypothetical protein
MKSSAVYIFILFTIISFSAMAQRGKGAGNHPKAKAHGHGVHHKHHRAGHKKAVVVKRSRYRPAKVVVFHPHWHPTRAYNRRWVYFPRLNFYWDHWRNHYVFWNGTIWLSQPAPPPALVNIDLSKEKQKELREDEDDIDDVYKSNAEHNKEE